nr:bifunctional diguanylate cyclase/phosphodiesterase [uncultured Sphingomonas sp.]
MVGERSDFRRVAERSNDYMSRLIDRVIHFLVIGAVILSFFGLYWATREGDRAMVERQTLLAKQALESSVDDVALQQESVAVWDELADHASRPKPDQEWLEGNAGGYLSQLYGHNEVYILDARDRPVFAYVGQGSVDPMQYFRVFNSVRHMVAALRNPGAVARGPHDYLPGSSHTRDQMKRRWRTYHVAHMLLVNGRPAAVSASNIIPATDGYVAKKGEWPIIISVRYLDQGFLAQVSARQLLRAPRFSSHPDVTGSDRAIALSTDWGEPMGYFIFSPEKFGTRILAKMLPWVAIILAGLTLFATMTGRRLRRSAKAIADAEADAAHLAYHDRQTGLGNRALFHRSLGEWIEQHHRDGTSFALMIVDVDEFKLINDTLGHDAGDAVLSAFAQRLLSATSDQDMVARLGGDEFGIMLANVHSADELERVGNQLLDLLRQPCAYHGQNILCRASVGATTLSRGDDSETLLKHADLALYEAKAAGRGTCRLYDPSLWTQMVERRDMLAAAEHALAQGHITPFYQPQVRLGTGEIVGFEALLRVCVPGQSHVGPEVISAAFEEPSLASRLADRMVERVIDDIVRWRADGLSVGHVAINASATELMRADFADRLLGQIDGHGIDASCIQIEVTEGVLLGRGAEQVERTFRQLAARGIRLALDDFGTGFASLSHLKQFPVEIIKIDRSFVRDLQIDPGDGAIVDALIGLAGAIQIEVVAEGVETRAQHDFLQALGCTYGQGYLFGPARPFDETSRLIRDRNKGSGAAAA